MRKEMKTAIEMYNKQFSKSERYLKDILLERAKELIIEKLSSDDVVVKKEERRDYQTNCVIEVILARSPRYGCRFEPCGDYKNWYWVCIYRENREFFPEDELNDWLKQYGWIFERNYELYGNDFQVSLRSIEIANNALNKEYIKVNGRYYIPSYMEE